MLSDTEISSTNMDSKTHLEKNSPEENSNSIKTESLHVLSDLDNDYIYLEDEQNKDKILEDSQLESNFNSLCETYCNLENKTVKLLLENKYQQQFNAEVIIVVSEKNKRIDKKINVKPITISIDYNVTMKEYKASDKKYLIPRLTNVEEIHNLHIYWDNDSNQFAFMFNALDATFIG